MLDLSLLKKGEHSIPITGGYLKFYIHNDIEENSMLPILFHGALDRNKIQLPYFEGKNIFNRNKKPAISFLDPIIDEYEYCRLAWFAGNDRLCHLQQEIHLFLEELVKETGVTFFFHGGSGGGFSALVQQHLFGLSSPHIAMVQNPQTSILKYRKGHIKDYLDTFTNIENYNNNEDVLNLYNIIHVVNANMVSNVIYFQNIPDTFHMENHFKNFIFNKQLVHLDTGVFCYNTNIFLFGTWGSGHERLPRDVVGDIFLSVYELKSKKVIDEYIKNKFSERLYFADIDFLL